jgi:hypothetical protein
MLIFSVFKHEWNIGPKLQLNPRVLTLATSCRHHVSSKNHTVTVLVVKLRIHWLFKRHLSILSMLWCLSACRCRPPPPPPPHTHWRIRIKKGSSGMIYLAADWEGINYLINIIISKILMFRAKARLHGEVMKRLLTSRRRVSLETSKFYFQNVESLWFAAYCMVLLPLPTLVQTLRVYITG